MNALFAYPEWLLALLVPVGAAIAYVWLQRRRTQRALVFGNFQILADVAPSGRTWMKHIAPISLLVALSFLIIALAGPISETKVARNRATVMMAVDVSFSMAANDVAPDRLTAAKQAGREFIESLPNDLNVGLVTFSGRVQTPVTPTTDHETVQRALSGAELSSATATGDAIKAALDAIANFGESIRGVEGPPPATIVLLSDGKQTIPTELDDPRGAYTAAGEAAELGIPINTISFGTPSGVVTIDNETIPVPNDDESLMEIARITEGDFYAASSLEQLREVYDDLSNDIGYELRRAENPRPWLLGSFAFLCLAVAFSLHNSRRVP